MIDRVGGWHNAGAGSYAAGFAKATVAQYQKELPKSKQKCKQQQQQSKKCRASFINPAPGYQVTDVFGWSAWRGRLHAGIDLGTPMGTPIKASNSGKVSYAGTMGGYGLVVDIDHCGKYTTRYAHLSQALVKKGQSVSQGQFIAKSGNTGFGTGPHLHFEIRIGGRQGTAQNPKNFIKF